MVHRKKPAFLLLPCLRTLYVHGFNGLDFSVWHAAIMSAAGTDGSALGDQQLTKNGVPIVVDSCVAFVTQYGEQTGGRGRGDDLGVRPPDRGGREPFSRFSQVCVRRGSTRGRGTPSGRPSSWRSSPETLAT